MAGRQEQALFSVLTSPDKLCKTFHQDPQSGEVITVGQTQLTDGEIETHGVSSLAEFNDILNALTHNQAITLGVFDPTVGAKARILSKERYASLADKSGVITRTREHIRFHPCPALMFYDIDTKWLSYAPPHVQALESIPDFLINFLDLRHVLIRGSSSSRIKDSTSAHIFTFINNGIYSPHLLEAQFRKLFIEGYGWIALSGSTVKPPSLLTRSLIDLAVKDPERIIYVAPPIITPPLIPRSLISCIEGDYAEQICNETPNLRDSEYNRVRETLKTAMGPTRIARTAEIYTSHMNAEVLRQCGVDPSPELAEKIRNQVARAFNTPDNLAVGPHQIFTDRHGAHAVSDIIITDFHAKVRGLEFLFHEQTCADPFEPEYGGGPGRPGRSKAKIFTDDNPLINSFAHGEHTIQLRIYPDDLIAAVTRFKDELSPPQLHDFLYKLWRVTLFKDYERSQTKNQIIDSFETKQVKSAVKDVIKSAEQNTLPELTEAFAQYEGLSQVQPEPTFIAEYYAQLHQDKIIFVYPSHWGRWTSNGWSFTKGPASISVEITEILRNLADFYPKMAVKIRSEQFLRETLKFLELYALNGQTVEFDKDPSVVQCANCIIDHRSKTIRAKTKKDFLHLRTPYDPIPGPTPVYDRFIASIASEDPALIADIEYCIARIFFPGLRKHILCIIGPTNSGKSVLLWILSQALGEYAISMDPEFFVKMNYQKSEERFFANIDKKKLALCHELPSSHPIDEVRLKRATGNDLVAKRELYKEQVSMTPHASFVLAGNFHPKLQKVDKAFSERLILIELENTFIDPNGRMPDIRLREYPAISDINEKLKREMPHILYKFIQLAFSYQDEVFHVPYDFKMTMADIDTNDPLMGWAKQCVEIVEQKSNAVNHYARAEEIRDSLKTWCVMNNVRSIPSDQTLWRFLTDQGAHHFREGDSIQEDGKIITCGNPQGAVWLDGKMVKPRKNIRLINVFAVGSPTERATDEPEAPGGQRTW